MDRQELIDFLEGLGWHRLSDPLRYVENWESWRPMVYIDDAFDGLPAPPHMWLARGVVRLDSMEQLQGLLTPLAQPEYIGIFL